MSNLYNLTKQIYKLLPKINQKYGLKIEIESDFYLHNNPKADSYKQVFYKTNLPIYLETTKEQVIKKWMSPIIQALQIRQILVGLQDVLGENPEFVEALKRNEMSHYSLWVPEAETQSEVFCQKWLDGLNPLFDREPETVLQELIDMLDNLLK